MSKRRPWTLEEAERARDLHAKGNSWTTVGRLLNRHANNCGLRVRQLNRGTIPTEGRVRVPQSAPEVVETNEPAHVTACLNAGGFGRLPIPWREPIRVWRAA
jgi:hypothetical protein